MGTQQEPGPGSKVPCEQGLELFRDFVDSHFLRWAKTYADRSPHWYTLPKYWDKDPADHEAFLWCVRFILSDGYVGRFGGYPYRFLQCGKYRYWTMVGLDEYLAKRDGKPTPPPGIINRCLIDENEVPVPESVQPKE